MSIRDLAECVDCGAHLVLCDHAVKRLIDPTVTYSLGVEEDLRAELATLQRTNADLVRARDAAVGALRLHRERFSKMSELWREGGDPEEKHGIFQEALEIERQAWIATDRVLAAAADDQAVQQPATPSGAAAGDGEVG